MSSGENMSEPIFRIRNVRKSYGNHTVLNSIDLDIQQGEIIGIIGGSGAGKTTFLHTLIGFIKPDEGDIEFRMNHLLSYKSAYVYKSVYAKQRLVKKIYGFASQLPSFYDELSPSENLEYFGLLHGLDKQTIKTNKKVLLDLMELEPAAHMPARNLSGGMERRLDIACSLMHDPDVLILDEPTADLDPVLRNHIWELIRKINKKGTTIILSSHHLAELEDLCDRVAIIKDGGIIAQGKPEALKKKYVTDQEIILRSTPGNYASVKKGLAKKRIIHTEVKDGTLYIRTKNPETDLSKILSVLKSKKERLSLIKVKGSSLDDVFIKIWNDNE